MTPKYNRAQFFNELHKRNISYVLLRWWENLPNFPVNEDMDLLIDDDDVEKIQDLLVNYTTENSCDIYTKSGSSNGSYKGLLYFTHALSSNLLNERRLFAGLAYVPSPRMSFVSLSYHALLHKGASSGIQGFGLLPDNPEHDYQKKLSKLRDDLNLNVEISAIPLFNWIKEQGFAPDVDTLAKLIDVNADLRIFSEPLYCNAEGGELCVFVIREQAITDGLDEVFCEIITKNKLEILKVVSLNEEEKNKCANKMRGGIWGKGAYSVSGGLTAKLVICFDYHPQALSQQQSMAYRWVNNKNLLDVKAACRNYIESNWFYTKQYNGIHTADNEKEALHYIQILSSDLAEEVSKRVKRIRKQYKTYMPVMKLFSAGRRSKVELVKLDNQMAVKKTYRMSSLRYFKREIFAYENLSETGFIPPLLSKGENYFIVPFFENILVGEKKKEIIRHLEKHRSKVIHVIEFMYRHKLTYINFTPDNVIITPQNEFYAIDFEFLQPYMDDYPNQIEDAIEVSGIPSSYKGDLPEGYTPYNSDFNSVWAPYIGKW